MARLWLLLTSCSLDEMVSGRTSFGGKDWLRSGERERGIIKVERMESLWRELE